MSSLIRQFSKSRVILFGIFLRLVLIPFVAHPFDMYSWYRFAEDIFEQGITFSYLGVGPIWYLFLSVLTPVYFGISNSLDIFAIPVSTLPANFDPGYGIVYITDPIFNLLIKIPLIVADFLSAFLIYRIVFHYSKSYLISRYSASLYFVSPIIIWISAGWGQYDSLAVLFTLFSFYSLLISKKIPLSAFCIFLAIMIKVYPIIFLVPMIISIYRFDENRRMTLNAILFYLVPISIFAFVFQKDVISFITQLIIPTTFYFTSGFGLTYWSVSLLAPIDILFSRVIMYLIMLILGFLSLYYTIRIAKTQFDTVILGSFLFTASYFLSSTVVSEQRSLILLALLSLSLLSHSSFRIYFLSLSFLAFIYAQKNFPFYLLPLASRFPESFEFLFSYTSIFLNRTPEFISPTYQSGAILFIIGTLFSSILVILIFKIFQNHNDDNNLY